MIRGVLGGSWGGGLGPTPPKAKRMKLPVFVLRFIARVFFVMNRLSKTDVCGFLFLWFKSVFECFVWRASEQIRGAWKK